MCTIISKVLATAALIAVSLSVNASENAAENVDILHAKPWKLTLGDYFYGGYSGQDLNLRWRHRDTDLWLGAYHDPVFGSQTRGGLDSSFNISPLLQVQPSLQWATKGFVGGSINFIVGDAWFGLFGIGRTNLKPYFNINFDPNDALTLGAGHRTAAGDVYSVFVVEDDRLHTRQQDWHANVRLYFGEHRATVDVLRKSGVSDAGPIVGWGASVTWDFPRWFVRVARDPYQNFAAQNAWRVATGVRF